MADNTCVLSNTLFYFYFIDQYRPPTSDAFKRPTSRPLSQQNGRVPTPKTRPMPEEQAVLRLTTSAKGNRPVQEPVAPVTVDQSEQDCTAEI